MQPLNLKHKLKQLRGRRARGQSQIRALRFAIVFTLAASVVLTISTPAQADSEDSLSGYSIMNLDVPDGFDKSVNPLGTDEDTPVLLVEEAELLRFASWNNNGTEGISSMSIYDTLKTGKETVESEAKSTSTINLRTNKTGIYGLNNVQAVSFNPAGTGRRDHVAFVGIDTSNKVKVAVYNTVSGKWSSQISLGSVSRYVQDGTDYYAFDGALSITAGDYDGDRKDTLVVYAATDGDCCYVHELNVKSTTYSLSISVEKSTSGFINPLYADSGLSSSSDKSGRDILRGEVHTGDFNGDNIDDLAVLTQVSKCNKYESDKYSYQLFVPYLCTACGSSNGGSILSHDATESCVCTYQRKDDDGDQYFDNLFGASMAIGDFDGEDYDTIVIVGRQLTIRDNEGDNLSDDWDFSDYLSFAKVYANGSGAHSMSLQTGDSSSLFINKLSKRCAKSNTNAAPSVSATAVCFDGPGTAAYLVVDAAIYTWNCTTVPVLQKNLANDNDWGDYGDVSFINSVAVGNFTAGEEGYEQLIFTLAEKNAQTQDDYNFRTVMVYASERDESTYEATAFSCTDSPDKFVDDKGDDRDEGVNGLVVAIDNDDDGIIVKYDSKTCYYTDPEVYAVLQAAPYFEELYKNDANNLQNGGETQLTISETHGIIEGEENSQDLEAGMDLVIGGIETPAKATIKAGYHGEWVSGWEESMSYRVSDTFMATTDDQVIVYRTPVYCYNYKVYNSKTGEFDSDATYYLKQKPTYVQMSLTEYEKFVQDYNSFMGQKSLEWMASNPGKTLSYTPLYSLSDLSMLGHEGNPYAYTVGGTTYGKKKSLSTTGGRSGVEYQITSEYTSYTEATNGGYASADIVSNMKLWPVNFGVNCRFEFNFTSTSAQVQGKEVVIRAEVSNLVASSFITQGYDEETYNAYTFDWQFCIYNTSIPGKTVAIGSECLNTVQVLGYRVSNVTAPPVAPEFTCSKLVSGEDYDYFDLRWEIPQTQSERTNIAKYRLYQVDSLEYKLVAEVDADTTSYKFRDLKSGKQEYVFYITAVDAQGNESTRSAAATCHTSGGTTLVKATYKGIVKAGTDTRYEYEIRYNDGSSYSFYLISAGSKGVDKGKPAFLKLQEEGLIPETIADWEEWKTTINDIHDLNGCFDSGEESYTLKLDECSEIRTTHCAICGNILTERHELHAHNFTETVVAGTCTTQGYTIYKCKNCGYEKHDNWVGYQHDYQEVEVPATCCSGGYTMEVCATCGEYHVTKKNTTPIDSSAHCYCESEPVLKLVDNDGDGKTDGHVHVECFVCKYCGKVKYGDVVDTVEHSLVESYVMSTDASGTEWYTKTEFCRYCDYSKALESAKTKTQLMGSSTFWSTVQYECGSAYTIDSLAFNDKTTLVKFTTKNSANVIGTVYCAGKLSLNGTTVTQSLSESTPSIVENDSGRWTIRGNMTSVATPQGAYRVTGLSWWLPTQMCSGTNAVHAYLDPFYDAASGCDLHTCVLCGHTEEASSATHTHTYTEVYVPESIAGTGGYVRKICTLCGYSETTTQGYDAEEANESCEHSWIELEHSCTDSAHVRRVCTCCGKTELVEKALTSGEEVAHQFTSTVVEPTCTTAGYTLKKCIRCGIEEKCDECDATGHTAAEGLDVVVEPTCEHRGYTVHTCTQCSEKYADTYTTKVSHKYEDSGKVTVEATCCSGEVTLNHCIYCGQTIQVGSVGEVVEDAHDYDVEVHELGCTTKGCFVYTCSHCGKERTVYFEDDPSTGITEEENTPQGHIEDTSVSPKVVSPTETESGYTLRHCAVCGEDYKTDPTEPIGEVHESKTYTSVGAPSKSLGQDGDIYIDLKNSKIYIKTDGAWVEVNNKQEEDVNIIVTEARSVIMKFDSEKVPVKDQEAISGELGKVEIEGLSDSIRLEMEKAILEKSFPELWEKVSMDSFLSDKENKITMHLQVSVNVVESDLFDEENPFIEFSFEPKVVMLIESPAYGTQTAEYRLTLKDFEDMGAKLTVTIPVCGNIVVTKVRHINAETGEDYEVFSKDGKSRFTYDEANNTVVIAINHFSNIRIEGSAVDNGNDGDENKDGVVNTGDRTGLTIPLVAGIVALLGIVVAFIQVKRRRA